MNKATVKLYLQRMHLSKQIQFVIQWPLMKLELFV